MGFTPLTPDTKPTVYTGGQTKLEIAAIDTRKQLTNLNYYNTDDSSRYSATHTHAISDKTTPSNGKGSGGDLDITNYAGVGSIEDKDGINKLKFTGRNQEILLNASTFGYGPNGLDYKTYFDLKPDSSKNLGQVNPFGNF